MLAGFILKMTTLRPLATSHFAENNISVYMKIVMSINIFNGLGVIK